MSETWEHSSKGHAQKRYDIIIQEYNYYFKKYRGNAIWIAG
jgi:hypothetical protein